MTERSIWLGFDPREADAYAVAHSSIRRRLTAPWPVRGVMLESLRRAGLYTRPTSRRDGRLWDDISAAPMATEFAISRFLVPHLAQEGWALFMDCDVLARANLDRLFDLADPTKAVMVVKHDHQPAEGTMMDGQAQTVYPRKNWSSVMLFNVKHPANAALNVDLVNTVPGRDLHRFCWLGDGDIGELPPEWNYLVGVSDPSIDAKIAHFTLGVPSMEGHNNCQYANEWFDELNRWAA
jgi:hypothetical protein